MRRVLLTGATGLIGRQLVPLLSAFGCQVHAVTRRPCVEADLNACADHWHHADLLEEQIPEQLIRDINPDGLIHLAWDVAPGNVNDEIHSHWLRASRNLIRNFYENGGKRALIAGTCFEYDWTEGVCSEATTARVPVTAYGKAKQELSQYVEDFCRAREKSWAWGRIFFVYGPHEHPRRFVPSVIRSLLRNEPAYCSHGRQVRDYLHSRDVADALLHLFGSAWDGHCNIASGEAVTLRQIGEEIGSQLGAAHLLRFGAKESPPGEPPVILADTNCLRTQLGWQPSTTLKKGIAETIEVYRQELNLPVSS